MQVGSEAELPNLSKNAPEEERELTGPSTEGFTYSQSGPLLALGNAGDREADPHLEREAQP